MSDQTNDSEESVKLSNDDTKAAAIEKASREAAPAEE